MWMLPEPQEPLYYTPEEGGASPMLTRAPLGFHHWLRIIQPGVDSPAGCWLVPTQQWRRGAEREKIHKHQSKVTQDGRWDLSWFLEPRASSTLTLAALWQQRPRAVSQLQAGRPPRSKDNLGKKGPQALTFIPGLWEAFMGWGSLCRFHIGWLGSACCVT